VSVRALKHVPVSLAVAAACLLNACASGRFGPAPDTPAPEGPRRLKQLTVTERRELLRRAKVWRAVQTESLNLLAGPPQPPAAAIPADLTCDFVFPHKPLSGNTPKFDCAIKPTDVVKVKYGAENGEVYGEVAASRLFWALGFQADAMYPARVTCTGCPEDPFRASKLDWHLGRPANARTAVFEPAAIEREVVGPEIEVPGFEGWAWPELDAVSETAGGATRAQIDALKLLAVFVQHSDTKPDQQALVCEGAVRKDASGNETCTSPWLVVKDLGTTFGKATRLNGSKMTLADWSGEAVWKRGHQCVGNLARSFTGSLDDPPISEAGRRLLSAQLARLRDEQIADLFRASHVERRKETIHEGAGDRPVTVNDWVQVFKRKRDEIASVRCSR